MIRWVVGFVLILLLGYGGFKAWPLMRGPEITLDSPTNYTTFPDGLVTVSGVAHNTEAVFLNDGPLLIDPKGHFYTTLLLPSGGAILSITAHDRFGRSTIVKRHLYVP